MPTGRSDIGSLVRGHAGIHFGAPAEYSTLEVEDPIRDAFTLEVSSPGIDRPLVRPRDFERHTGYEAKIEMHGLINGQRRFQGRILGFADGVVRLEAKDGEVELPIDDVQNAKLVMTDELLAAATTAG